MYKDLKEEKVKTEKRNNSKKKTIVGLSIALGIFASSTLGLGIAYGISSSTAGDYAIQLENVYQKNLYDLVESVNNTETKLGKVVASNDRDFQGKTLVEISNNTELAEQSISSLPVTENSISETVKFINQVGGYSSTLAKKLSKGKNLTSEELKTLSDIQNVISSIKMEINKFMIDSQNTSILEQSLDFLGDKNSFTIKISKMEDVNIEYPTMIYDGPFSDSETNIDIRGLSGNLVNEDKAYSAIEKCFKNIASHSYEGEINSNIETYNFKIDTTTNHTLYAQVSKIGGNIITVSGTSDSLSLDNYDMDQCEKVAIDFASENGIENPKCVWSDKLYNEAYFNIAPVQDGVILYPDLVKVKIDLSSGTVIGYDASTYFTNHTKRLLSSPALSETNAKEFLPSDYNFEEGILVLAPLDYSREILCYEFKGEKYGDVYYFYINANSGKEENILKVVETSDGSKLM